MAISAKEVNKLRQMTGAGMMDCKKALTEANGDFDEAIELLRKKGQKVSAKRADKEATEGSIFTKVVNDGKTGYMIALSCETDFVAKNEEFQSLGSGIIDIVSSGDLTSKEVVLTADYGDGRTISEHITDLVGKIGEKIELSSLEKIDSEGVTHYIHSNSKLGVLVGFKGVDGLDIAEVGKDVAMQIAAMNPVALDKDEVPQEIIEQEKKIGREQAIAEGKPENIVDKIAEGKLNKYFKDNTLLHQQFVKDPSKTVKQMVSDVSKNLSITEFKRVTIG